MTQHVASMFKAESKDLGTFDQQKPAERIEACFKYLQICIACADACLAEDMVANLTQCIGLNRECADACRRCEKACAELLATIMG